MIVNEISNGWTLESYIMHNEAMRLTNDRFIAEVDRRYTEGNELRAMALKIKETADRDALELDRASQTYKAEKNDSMREQTISDKGQYATHADVALVVERMEKSLKPIVEYIANQQGGVKGSDITMGKIYAAIGAFGVILGAIIYLFK